MEQGEPRQAGAEFDWQAQPSLERGLAGDYELSAGEVVKEAWHRVSGNKATIWASLAFYLAAAIAVSLLLSPFTGSGAETVAGTVPGASPTDLLLQLLTNLLLGPIGAGVIFVGVAIASDSGVKSSSVFSWFDRILPLFLTYFLMVLMIMLGTMLLVLPGVYLAISYLLALPLVADRQLGPWEALETSRKIITHRWFTVFGLWLMATFAVVVSSLLVGLPLIWVLPAIIIGIGILYRNCIGARPASLARVSGDA